jgi:multidrug efflux pump subunit AcrB
MADLFSVRESEIHIEISEHTLRRYGLTLGQVADAIRRSSFDLPAGSVKTASGEILIRTKGRRYHAADYRDVAVITRTDGSKVTLGQIADLKEGFQDVDLFARFQGAPAAIIQVYRVADQNALEVADAVKKYVDEFRASLPEGVRIDFFDDMSRVLKSRIELLLKNMAFGLLLVAFLLSIFLNLKLAFWVTMGIPVSFLAGIWALPAFDVSINMISLFAFIMVLGIVVDDAIVIGENVFRKQEEGLGPLEASVKGTLEVGIPVIFSVLTTVAAFWPLLLGAGMMGKVMRNIPIVVILVLLASLTESLLILPAHLERSRRRTMNRGKPIREKWSSRLLKSFVGGPYAKAVDFCVRWRYATLALGIAMLLLTWGVWEGGLIKFTLFPRVEGDVLTATVTMPAGIPVERTVEVVRHLEKTAKEALAEAEEKRPAGSEPLFEHSVALVGMHMGGGHGPAEGSPEIGGHLAQVFVQLLDGEKRDVGANTLVGRWRRKAGQIPDAEAVTFQSTLFTPGNPVEIHLSLDNHEQLMAAADELKAELEKIPGVFDVGDSFLPGKKEMQLSLKPAARSLGLTLNDLAMQVRHAFYGAEALRLQRDRDEVKVLVRYPESERKSLGNVEEMRIRTPAGMEVPFRQVAEARMEQAYAAIERAQRLRVIKVTADVDENRANASEIRKSLEDNFLASLANRYPGIRYGMEGEGKEQREALDDVIRGFVIALFAIYALLAVPFKSFTQPFIVMIAIPFGMVGAVAGHLLMGFDLSFLSLFGMVGLAGVAVNDSLVLIDAANRIRGTGTTAHDAVVAAGRNRFRAIILTSLTTFAGLVPIIFEKSIQARFLIPMALSLGFGVLFATGITLLLIPSLYMILDDLHILGDRIFGRARGLEPGADNL